MIPAGENRVRPESRYVQTQAVMNAYIPKPWYVLRFSFTPRYISLQRPTVLGRLDRNYFQVNLKVASKLPTGIYICFSYIYFLLTTIFLDKFNNRH